MLSFFNKYCVIFVLQTKKQRKKSDVLKKIHWLKAHYTRHSEVKRNTWAKKRDHHHLMLGIGFKR